MRRKFDVSGIHTCSKVSFTEQLNSVASANCTAVTITTWAETMSAYIKSIDPNHLVAIGDEGFINAGSSNYDYPYQGEVIGIDFAANMAISSLDFGTYHVRIKRLYLREHISTYTCSALSRWLRRVKQPQLNRVGSRLD